MWKPSKGIVVSFLIVMLFLNLMSVLMLPTFTGGYYLPQTSPRYSISSDGLHVEFYTADELIWWETEMGEIDNDPNIIGVLSGGYQPTWQLSDNNELNLRHFKIMYVENTILSDGTELPIGTTTWQVNNWITNLSLPWISQRNKFEFYVGRYDTLVLDNRYLLHTENEEVDRWENLDFTLVDVSEVGWWYEFSLWGPIHLLIVIGALVYVWKRWD